MRGGYSTSPEAVDRFYKNSHKLARLKKHVKDRLHVKITSTHNETSAGAKTKHEMQIVSLIEKLQTYYTNSKDKHAVFRRGLSWNQP